MGQTDDKNLMEGCLKNDRVSQKLLYETYAPIMLGVCMRYANCKDEAEDIMIEGFVKFFSHIDTYKNECSLFTWIKRIMVNTAISYCRTHSKHYYNQSIDEYDTIEIPDQSIQMDDSFSEKEILEAIQKMPKSLSIVLNMRAFDGLDYSDIAKKLDITEIACRCRFSKAKKWLEEHLNIEVQKK